MGSTRSSTNLNASSSNPFMARSHGSCHARAGTRAVEGTWTNRRPAGLKGRHPECSGRSCCPDARREVRALAASIAHWLWSGGASTVEVHGRVLACGSARESACAARWAPLLAWLGRLRGDGKLEVAVARGVRVADAFYFGADRLGFVSARVNVRVQGAWREQYVSVAADSAVVGVVCEVDGEDRVLMVEQYRTPTGGPTHELIAGRVDEGAGCVRTAQSEALEEAGVSLCTNDLVCLGSMYASRACPPSA